MHFLTSQLQVASNLKHVTLSILARTFLQSLVHIVRVCLCVCVCVCVCVCNSIMGTNIRKIKGKYQQTDHYCVHQ